MTSFRIEPRWLRIDEEKIYQSLLQVGLTTWKPFFNSGIKQYYLYGYTDNTVYGYPYSLPLDVIVKLATRLNKGDVYKMWYKSYNARALTYFSEHGKAEFEALEYWERVNTYWKGIQLPKPQILPILEDPNVYLEPGTQYYALIGFYHLLGSENHGNSHIYFDFIDRQGTRLYGTKVWFGWEGISSRDEPFQVVTVDKGLNEPGGNIFVKWETVMNGFYAPNIPLDRFKGVHTRYPHTPTIDTEGNFDGHHSHYIVYLLTTVKDDNQPPTPPPPTPLPTGPTIVPVMPPDIISHQMRWIEPGVMEEITRTRVYTVEE